MSKLQVLYVAPLTKFTTSMLTRQDVGIWFSLESTYRQVNLFNLSDEGMVLNLSLPTQSRAKFVFAYLFCYCAS